MDNVKDILLEGYRRNEDYCFVGDLIEWEDYDEQLYQSRIHKITYYPSQNYPMDVQYADLRVKKEYHFMLDNGFSIIGGIVKRKIFEKKKKSKLPKLFKLEKKGEK